MRAYPHKSSELIQYNHVIHSISLTYVWDNVYGYDKEFRLHLSKHPNRNWAVILQQAWSMKLRDRIPRTDGGHKFVNHSGNNNGYVNNDKGSFKSSDPCKLFNKGHCKFGKGCKFEHKCSYCGKFGHPVLNCRKLQADRERVAQAKRNGTPNHIKKEVSSPNNSTD